MRSVRIILIVVVVFFNRNVEGQIFKRIPFDSLGVTPYALFPTKEGVTWMTTSVGMLRIKGRELTGPSINDGRIYDINGRVTHQKIKIRNYTAEDSIRAFAQGTIDSSVLFVLHDNMFLWRPNGEIGGWSWTPVNFPKKPQVTKIWIDKADVFVGTVADNFFIIKEAGDRKTWKNFTPGADQDSSYLAIEGAKAIQQIAMEPGTGVYCFAVDANDTSKLWLGTSRGLLSYNKQTGKVTSVPHTGENEITITEIYTGEKDNLWFSTLEKGMGVYNFEKQAMYFYPYSKKKNAGLAKYPIKTFSYKSPNQFFVAVADSLPAIFNTKSRTYLFFKDSALLETPNITNDIKVDRLGNVLMIKGGSFYYADVSKSDLLRTSFKTDSSLLFPFIREIRLADGHARATLDFHPDLLKKITLEYDQAHLIYIHYDVNNFSDETDIQFAWKLEGDFNDWIAMPPINNEGANVAMIQDLSPGKYTFKVKVKIGKEEWRRQIAELEIVIKPAYWQTWWFWLCVVIGLSVTVFLIIKVRVRAVRKNERMKSVYEKNLLELEAKALRSQMNPHFIFNCLNSIKALMQEKETEKGVAYLTTFSKLIRTLFNNADKKEITLYDEIETCKFYLQLETMRFNAKLSYLLHVQEGIDLKSIYIPALIIQPFIENAIWHGIVPKEEGGNVTLAVSANNGKVEIIIEDDGIGREASQQNKPDAGLTHQSKGINLTEARLKLDNLLQQRQATVETIDKKDDKGNATGTKVIITIKEEI